MVDQYSVDKYCRPIKVDLQDLKKQSSKTECLSESCQNRGRRPLFELGEKKLYQMLVKQMDARKSAVKSGPRKRDTFLRSVILGEKRRLSLFKRKLKRVYLAHRLRQRAKILWHNRNVLTVFKNNFPNFLRMLGVRMYRSSQRLWH